LVLLIFSFAGFYEAKGMEGVIINPNRSLILGKVEKIKKDFPLCYSNGEGYQLLCGGKICKFCKRGRDY